MKVDWFSGIEVSSVEMVQTYVVRGYGIGVTVGVPRMQYHPQVRPLPLEGFEAIDFGVIWQGRRSALLDAFFKHIEKTAQDLTADRDAALLPLR
jgi:DNA-binding transcriptional LysR family regulator